MSMLRAFSLLKVSKILIDKLVRSFLLNIVFDTSELSSMPRSSSN